MVVRESTSPDFSRLPFLVRILLKISLKRVILRDILLRSHTESLPYSVLPPLFKPLDMKNSCVLLWLFCFLFSHVYAQVNVSTVTNVFNGSGGVRLGPDGWVYIADFGASLGNQNGFQIWQYDPGSGTLQEFATGFSGASGNDFDSQGNLFQSNIAISTISKVSPTGNVSFFVSQGISGPVGIVIDDQDNLFICNCGNNTIQKVTPTGTSSLFSTNPGYSCPNGITRDHNGNLYMSNFNDGKVFRIDAAGNGMLFATIPGGNNGHLTFSSADSMLYLASHGSSRIYQLSLTGGISVVAGSGIRGNQDGPALTASFSRPNGIAVSVTGDTLYINSSVPITNQGAPLNPSLLRMITGVQPASVSIDSPEFIQEVSIFPNPVAGQLHIQFAVTEHTHIQYSIYTLEGKTILEDELSAIPGNNPLTIDLEPEWKSGLYLLHLRHPQQSISQMIRIE